MRVLVTGFGPFPGIPVNPSAALARYLVSHRRVRYAGIARNLRVLPTEWSMLEGVEQMLQQEQPDLVLMFGVAGRRRKVTPETRLVPHHALLKPDAAGRYAVRAGRVDAASLRPHVSLAPVLASLKAARVPSRKSRDAGRYLCNGLAHEVIRLTAAKGVPALFVHIPMPQGRLPLARIKRRKPGMATLKRGAVAVLDALLLQAKRA